MITAGDFRNGVTFEEDGNVMQIIEFQHVKPGKGAAFVRTKVRNVITGSVVEKTYNPSAKFPTAFVERKDMEYTYSDGELYHFVELEITQTDPGFAGNTATNATKPATLETGAEIRVPLFINEGEVIRIDTRTGEYMERVK